MRDYEKLAQRDARVKQATDKKSTETREPCSSSAMDQGSESSVTSDTVPVGNILFSCPRIERLLGILFYQCLCLCLSFSLSVQNLM